MLLATLSIAWSFYPGASALAVLTQWATTIIAVALGLVLSWGEILRTLGVALRWIVALSLLFELWVALWVREPLLPNFVNFEQPIPKAFYWSRDLLLSGGPIEGIVGNRNLLGFVALLAVIVSLIQLAADTVQRGWGIAWLIVSVATLLLTRSATVTVATLAVAVVAAFAMWTRRRPPEKRLPVYLTAALVAIASVITVTLAWTPLLKLLGKSSDLTFRFEIWSRVSDLANERPFLGWGWVGYWNPWVEPFNDLAVFRGVTYLQAHNAWLDIALQLGALGLIIFTTLVLSTLWRSWFIAVDQPRDAVPYSSYRVGALLPLLLMTALLVQSLAESRILVEGGWTLLIMCAFLSKRGWHSPEEMP